MIVTYEASVTTAQRNRIQETLRKTGLDSSIDATVTFQSVAEPSAPGHQEYACTIGGSGVYAVEMRASLLADTGPEFFEETVAHELAHVLCFDAIATDLAKTGVCALFTLKDGSGTRGELGDWENVAWADNIKEAVAEVLKDAFLSTRVYDNRTNWKISAADWPRLFDFLGVPNVYATSEWYDVRPAFALGAAQYSDPDDETNFIPTGYFRVQTEIPAPPTDSDDWRFAIDFDGDVLIDTTRITSSGSPRNLHSLYARVTDGESTLELRNPIVSADIVLAVDASVVPPSPVPILRDGGYADGNSVGDQLHAGLLGHTETGYAVQGQNLQTILIAGSGDIEDLYYPPGGGVYATLLCAWADDPNNAPGHPGQQIDVASVLGTGCWYRTLHAGDVVSGDPFPVPSYPYGPGSIKAAGGPTGYIRA